MAWLPWMQRSLIIHHSPEGRDEIPKALKKLMVPRNHWRSSGGAVGSTWAGGGPLLKRSPLVGPLGLGGRANVVSNCKTKYFSFEITSERYFYFWSTQYYTKFCELIQYYTIFCKRKFGKNLALFLKAHFCKWRQLAKKCIYYNW